MIPESEIIHIDPDCFFYQRNGKGATLFAKGKHKHYFATFYPDYLKWMLTQKFHPETLILIREILDNPQKHNPLHNHLTKESNKNSLKRFGGGRMKF